MTSCRSLTVASLALGSLILLAAASAAGRSGSLDPRFGRSGIVITPIGVGADAYDLLRQTDGKLIAVGSSRPCNGCGPQFALARYRGDGSLDPSFGTGGIVTTSTHGLGYAGAAALQPDGKILAAGLGSGGFALARYKADGSLDQSFGEGGVVSTSIGYSEVASAVSVQPDGKIVAAGAVVQVADEGTTDFALARYMPNGELDPSFGDGGIVTTSFGTAFNSDDGANELALQPDGKIVVAGGTEQIFPERRASFALARYQADGQLDPSFGNEGLVTTSLSQNDRADALVLQPDGKIVVAGHTTPETPLVLKKFALARYRQDGSLDPRFGDDGIVTTSFPLGSAISVSPLVASVRSSASAEALVLQPDGKIVAAGAARDWPFALARYSRNGLLDPSFGVGGRVNTADSNLSVAWALTLQPDGKIVAAGNGKGFALARYLGGSNRLLKVKKRGGGKILSKPAALSCGKKCSAWFGRGARVKLIAKPRHGSTVRWKGICKGHKRTCRVKMKRSRTVKVTFVRKRRS